MSNRSYKSHPRPDLRVVASKLNRTVTPATSPGFTRRELQRLVAEMID